MDAFRGQNDFASYPHTGHFLAGRLRERLSASDLDHLESLVHGIEQHDHGTRLIARGQTTDRSMMLIEGFVFRTIEKGNKRSIVGVHVPGDFVDLHGFAMKRLDHNIDAAGPVKIGYVEHSKLRAVIQERPALTHALWFATLLDAAIHRRWIQMLGNLEAPRQIAHVYAELHTRLGLIGYPEMRVLRTPFTQADLADMCGVSAIHANRAVAKLRDAGVGEIRRGDLFTRDWDALKAYAHFEPAYLYGQGPLFLREELE
ncbi:Crp/Fnr family transcriptional regulator [Aurantiacibacter aquimixticola]|uniref:Crp/Fnr family transcriptional regulator n=1 Tax=Aurantiacibacter aquimixticola TaxID=1958945 RepID=A0A419RSG3_9SPHN|nr:Crp/Fnr family transcriptional regulator [Aurantiacibacter aquimixticola]RJY08720.1 Crp/Fnr family transcriptional regulator [Aurantiacibacter aquimixticola]